MSKSRIRVESRNPHGSRDERERSFKEMFMKFKKYVNESKILHAYKQKEFYEKPGDKKRRRARELEIQRFKNKLRESFPEKGDREDYRERGGRN